ncbi:unnamed protein product [Vitrella brassicaformis CCMP3155]|uniref:phosphatidylserine decarboxylase n=1 Tax=Vitrella brassicaformis (strain CCMP3155) TaxID=1169540 RepID=A0A0G4G1G8_VITBC|nr:unnamed protein product [Vitrella brassicaformis CCMP3155]|mmetsp:Transcript_24372/g.60143  ORF Transcript_24372/g.60143 Transcript_24372/m.60143 type:complete len:393 (-) Transcript_24372:412-1590(-)|eukprot:CEM21705.1 unnamed protein product [Vitrella brassicaformis CCMP3155]
MGTNFSRRIGSQPKVGVFTWVSHHPKKLVAGITAIVLFNSDYKFGEAVQVMGNSAGLTNVHTLWFLRIIFGRTRSRWTGFLMAKPLPHWTRKHVFGAGAYLLGINMDEVRYPIDSYRSITDFFCRQLLLDARPIEDAHPSAMVSPCDCKVMTLGDIPLSVSQRSPTDIGGGLTGEEEALLYDIRDDRYRLPAMKVKGTSYLMRHFLGEDPRRKASKPLKYCVLYLGPADYHHFHSPCEYDIRMAKHFPGDLLPVNSFFFSTFNDIFAVNERVVVNGNWHEGKLWFAAVGAYNVGSIKLSFDRKCWTNRYRTPPVYLGGEVFSNQYKDGVRLDRSEHLGHFRLGSSIILIFEAPEDWEWTVQEGQKLRVGQRLGALKGVEPVPPEQPTPLLAT